MPFPTAQPVCARITLSSLPERYHEFSSIIISRLTYMVMRPHRFVFNLGYANIAASGGVSVTSTAMLLSALFLELAFEFLVDNVALQVESGHVSRQGETAKLYWGDQLIFQPLDTSMTTVHHNRGSACRRFGQCGDSTPVGLPQCKALAPTTKVETDTTLPIIASRLSRQTRSGDCISLKVLLRFPLRCKRW